MLKLRSVLFPTDFSPCAERAYTHAWYLARRHGARLHILSIAQRERDAVSNPMNFLPLGRDELAAQLGLDAAIIGEDETKTEDPDTVNVQIRSVSAWRAILEYTEENSIDLIVMGTHGRHGLDRVLMGSVAEQVVRRAPCPVLTVRQQHNVRPQKGLRQVILAPVDFSSHSERALGYVRELADLYDAEVHLLHIIQPVTLPNVYGIDPVPVLDNGLHEKARQGLIRIAKESFVAELPLVTEVMAGHAGNEIIEYATARDVDMIVIGTHGLTGVKRLLMGSVTEQVVRDAPCPVFTVRSFGRTLLTDKDEDTSSMMEDNNAHN